MKVLSTEQIRASDAFTIANEPIASIDLMERASEAFVAAYLKLPLGKESVTIVCGPGNNGGDGLAVARLLLAKGLQVQVWMVKLGANLSPDCQTNMSRWLKVGKVTEVSNISQIEKLEPIGVIIDALFGSGLSRGVTGLAAQVINIINSSNCPIVAVDMPSGLFAEKPNPEGAVVEADFTLSFQTPKLAFFLPQNQANVGDWQILDIGLDQNYIEGLSSKHFAVDHAVVQRFERKPDNFAHKGKFGHALLVAGSKGKIGAAVLSSKAALRGGLGLLSVHLPACGYQVIQTAVPEAMCQVDVNENINTNVPVPGNITAIGIGPGIGTDPQTVKTFENILTQNNHPMVVDADGLNILGEHHDYLQLLPPNTILTPHPKEFQRLAGEIDDDYHRLEVQSEFSKKYQVILVYKGAFTTVALPDGRLFFNTTGNSGMATAGSGDVLTGLILGLLTRTGDPVLASVVGVYLHGMAGDLAAESISEWDYYFLYL
jgi:NAD(P)H-hydrate epimerase